MVDRGVLDSNRVLPFPMRRGTNQRLLPPHFKPGNWDVICHNGKCYKSHLGNMRFKVCIGNYLRSFMKASRRSEKSAVITDIVASIRDSSDSGGGFVRFDSSLKKWYEVGDKIARDKVGQALRDDTLRNQKSIRDATACIRPAVISVIPRKVSEIGKKKKSNLATSTLLPFTPIVAQLQNGCDTGDAALSSTTDTAVADEHNSYSSSSTPPMRRYSTVTVDSSSDYRVRNWNDSSSQFDHHHCFTSTSISIGTCTITHDANPPSMMEDFVEDNVVEWFEREMAAR